MEQTNPNMTMENLLISFNKFQYEMMKSMNCIREDIKELKGELKEDIKELRNEVTEFKEETNKRWEENNKRWDENDRRWEENNKRWDENNKQWKINENRWEKYETNRSDDKKYILDILTSYDISISEQLGDPNVEKMRKLV